MELGKNGVDHVHIFQLQISKLAANRMGNDRAGSRVATPIPVVFFNGEIVLLDVVLAERWLMSAWVLFPLIFDVVPVVVVGPDERNLIILLGRAARRGVLGDLAWRGAADCKGEVQDKQRRGDEDESRRPWQRHGRYAISLPYPTLTVATESRLPRNFAYSSRAAAPVGARKLPVGVEEESNTVQMIGPASFIEAWGFV